MGEKEEKTEWKIYRSAEGGYKQTGGNEDIFPKSDNRDLQIRAKQERITGEVCP